MSIFAEIKNRIKIYESLFNKIPNNRRKLLNNCGEYLSSELLKEKELNLLFICTHNSRRSQIAQIWAEIAASYYNIRNVFSYSGGTVSTAFNIRAVNALIKNGIKIKRNSESENPTYFVYYSTDSKPIKCFSKIYSDKFNPQKNFIAMMTCSEADRNCPVVFGAKARFSISYDDPGKYDNTEYEKEKYDETVKTIATEMLYLFNHFTTK